MRPLTLIRTACGLAAAALLGACATAYQPGGLTGGFYEADRGSGVWRVSFAGNGYTTEETAQTYWLYHCAQLALDKGYQGFRITSNMKLSAIRAVPVPVPVGEGGERGPIVRVGHHSGGGGGHYTYVYTGGYSYSPHPSRAGDIQLLKGPIEEKPLQTFDAAKLAAALAPIVNGEKCNGGNICPHVHKYLYPGLEVPPVKAG